MSIDCCKDCIERRRACWGSCPRYQEEKKAHDAQKEAVQLRQKTDRDIDSAQYHALNKRKKEALKRRKQGRGKHGKS